MLDLILNDYFFAHFVKLSVAITSRDIDSYSSIIIISIPEAKGISKELLKRAVIETFDTGRCSCQHDCCGCSSEWVSKVTPINNEVSETYHLAISIEGSYNI